MYVWFIPNSLPLLLGETSGSAGLETVDEGVSPPDDQRSTGSTVEPRKMAKLPSHDGGSGMALQGDC